MQSNAMQCNLIQKIIIVCVATLANAMNISGYSNKTVKHRNEWNQIILAFFVTSKVIQ
jgi:hypothetical protein